MTQEERDEKFVAYWERKQVQGKWRFAFFTGVLTWALPVFASLEVFRYLTRRADYQFDTSRLLIGGIIWCVMGFFIFGLWMWHANEKAYQKSKKRIVDKKL